MDTHIDRLLIDRDSIAERVEQLGAQVVSDLGATADDGRLVVMPVMTGSLVFTADLVRCLPLSFRILPVTVSSYTSGLTQSGGVGSASPLPAGIEGKVVLLVEDILDSGQTLAWLIEALTAAGAAEVHCCTLLRKDVERVADVDCTYVGFDIPDVFVVGYGRDVDGLHRNLPDIAVLKVGEAGMPN